VSARLHTREESGITLDRELRWFHDGQPVEHPRIIEAFNQGLRVGDDGRYLLVIGADWCVVKVADAAFAVLALDVLDDGALAVRLSDRTAEPLDEASLTLEADGVLTARVKQGRAKARFTRDAQFSLGELLTEGPQGLRLTAGGRSRPVAIAGWRG